jgi:hypothetical protein
MNNIQQQLVRQMRSFLTFKKEHETEIAENPLLVKMATDIESIEKSISELLGQQDRNSKALTQEKSSKINDLIELTVKVCEVMSSYGNYTNFKVFTNIEGCSKTELSRCRDVEVLIRAERVVMIMEENPTEVTEATISAEDITALKAAIAAAQAVIDIPQEFRRSQHDITVKLEDGLERYRNIMNNSLKDYMRSKYQQSNPDLYSAFALAVDVDAIPKRKKALVGTILDEKGAPVRKVRVSVDGSKPVIRGGKKGGFNFQNLTPGEHQLTFSRKSYQSVTVNILIVPDKTTTLDVVLNTIKVEEAVPVE